MRKRESSSNESGESSSESFFGCPKGHRLPNQTPTGSCTAIYCAAQVTPAEALKKLNRQMKRHEPRAKSPEPADLAVANEADAHVAALIPGDDVASVGAREIAATQRQEQLLRFASKAGQLAARAAILKTPKDLKPDEIEKWVEAKKLELLPWAMAELEYQLKFGDDKQRAEASREIRDATGHGKREIASAASTPIIILTGAGVQQLPWSQAKTQVIDITPNPLEK